jgi:predicted phage terminase large subunit-like protein
VRFWDLAMSEKTSADYTVGVKMGLQTNGRIVILDVERHQIEWDNVTPLVARVALEDGSDVLIGLEEKGYMSRAVQQLIIDPRLHHYGIWGYPKDKDKLTNALPFAARVGAEMVDIVDSYFTDTFLDEVCSFPLAANDDQVDAASGAYEMLGGPQAMEGAINYASDGGISSSVY